MKNNNTAVLLQYQQEYIMTLLFPLTTWISKTWMFWFIAAEYVGNRLIKYLRFKIYYVTGIIKVYL